MGILSRFRDIMASNMNALLDQAEDPEKTIDNYMRSLNSDLGKVKAETASMLMDERRARRAWDECLAEIKKLQRYVEKAAESGNEEGAGKFLERMQAQAEKEAQLQAAYEAAASNAESMRKLQDKLMSDIGELEARRVKLKEKMAAAKVQQRMNAIGSSYGGKDSVFDAMEEKADRAYNEAMAIKELREGPKDDLDDLIAQLEKRPGPNAENDKKE